MAAARGRSAVSGRGLGAAAGSGTSTRTTAGAAAGSGTDAAAGAPVRAACREGWERLRSGPAARDGGRLLAGCREAGAASASPAGMSDVGAAAGRELAARVCASLRAGVPPAASVASAGAEAVADGSAGSAHARPGTSADSATPTPRAAANVPARPTNREVDTKHLLRIRGYCCGICPRTSQHHLIFALSLCTGPLNRAASRYPATSGGLARPPAAASRARAISSTRSRQRYQPPASTGINTSRPETDQVPMG